MKYLIPFLLLPFSIIAQKRPVDYVNPFIGTGGHGHTFPGATVPFGMVQLSPDTRTEGWDAASGYHYSDSTILGFSHTHLNGTGVNDLCDVLITPSVKDIQGGSLTFNHKYENAKAGFYSLDFIDEKFKVELTSTERVGFHRYKFDKTAQTVYLNVLLNARNEIINSNYRVLRDDKITGYISQNAWAKQRFLAFCIESNSNFETIGLSHIIGKKNGAEVVDSSSYNKKRFMLKFDVSKTHEILLKVALSPVSEENAAENMQAEIPHWDFDKTHQEAEAKWSKYLNRIQIEGGSEDQRTIFYTALYHTLIHPSVSQDVNGDYRGLDNKVYNSHTFQYHSIFSLWDTYRAAHPLYTILCPEKVPDFINGFLDDFEKSGHLPVWNFPGNETWCMIGNHSIPVIADAYLKGIRGFDAEKALNAMIKTVNRDTFGLKAYREKGYIPADTEGESVSKTLEYAYDDYCIAQMARALNKENIYSEYIKRSQNWKNIFNPKTGFFQAKINETFVEPFNPREVNIHYTEGNAWQYAFAVQHDIFGLMSMHGGYENFHEKLDAFFNAPSETTGRDQVDITGLIGQYAHGNEPSHHIAYLYNYLGYRPDYAGKPDKKNTGQILEQIMTNFYKNAPDGLIGNEDCGQMSAWFVLSSLGQYPVNPCGIEYVSGFSIFKNIKIQTTKDTFNYDFNKNHTLVYNNGDTTLYTEKGFTAHWKDPFLKFKPMPDFYERIFTVAVPFISKGTKLFKNKQFIELNSAEKESAIFYTTDGSDPRKSGIQYNEPIDISDSKTFKFVTARKFSDNLNIHYSKIATAHFKKIQQTKTITLKNPPAPQFFGGATDALVDGEMGTEKWQLGGFQGFEGVDLEAIVDLKKETDFRRVVLRTIEDQNAWIFSPIKIQVFTSHDGQNFELFSSQTPDFKPNTEGVRIRDLGIKKKGRARYIKLIAKPLNPIPAWHKGAGGKGWIFADEILID
jgi:predicted alpha-1,2-mannosidase